MDKLITKKLVFSCHTPTHGIKICPVAPIVVQGEADVTVGNRVCQMWGSSRPHSTGKYGEMVDSDAGHNGCRNPSGSSGGVWCYTVDPAKRWEYCAVPYC